MRTNALDIDAKFIARRHDRTGRDPEVAGGHAWPIVDPEHGIDGKLFEQPVLNHRLGTCATFLSRLEDEHDRAIELAVLSQMFRRAEQHGGVAVVSTCVHASFVLRSMSERVDLGDRQCVHIGAQTHVSLTRAAFQHPDDAGLSHAAMYFQTPSFEIVGDQLCCADFFITQLGMRVDRSSQRFDFLVRRFDFWNQIHETGLCLKK